jgi:hypothetical protein
MPRYLLAYHGGHLEETPEGQRRVAQANEVSGAQRVHYQIKGPVSAPAANERM